jgi:guanylate kinase
MRRAVANQTPPRIEMSLGPLIIVSGPAGSGKTTLIHRALREFGPRLRHSVSATTRPPRGAEVDGIDYHFWTRDRFEQGIAAGEFLEHATVFGRHYYGTLRSEVDQYRARGVGVILDIDVQGADQLRRACPGAFFVFVETPPGEYERRLRERGTDAEEAIQRRLAEARWELARAGEFDRRIVNDDADRAAAELCAEIRRLFETNQGRQPCSRS